MPEPAERPVPAKSSDGSRRIYVFWGVGMTLLALLGLFCWRVAMPFLEVRREVGALHYYVVELGDVKTEKVPEMALAAVRSLGGPEKAISKIELWMRLERRTPSTTAMALIMLGQCGEPAVDRLVPWLGDTPNYPGSVAATALGRIGPPARKAVPGLVGLAVETVNGDNADWIEPLQKIDPEGALAVPLLIDLLESGDPIEREGAAYALGRFGSAAKPGVPLLIKALDDPATARGAARALACLGPEAKEAVPALIRALGSEDWAVRGDAVWALGRMGPESESAAPALVTIVTSKGDKLDDDTRYCAAMALGRIGRKVVPQMVAALENTSEEPHPFVDSLVMIGPEAVPEMIKVQDDYSGLNAVLTALQEMGPKAAPAAPWLIERLKRTEVRWAHRDVVCALGAIGPAAKEAVPVLVAALSSESRDLRQEAALALGRIGDGAGQSLPALEAMAGDGDPGVRLAASAAAFRVKDEIDKAVDALMAGLTAEDTRRVALDELGSLGPKAGRAAPALQGLLPASAVTYWRVTGDSDKAIGSLLPLLRKSGCQEAALYLIRQMGPAARPALGWVVHYSSDVRSSGVPEKTWTCWHIRGIDDPPSLRPEDRDLRWPPPKPPQGTRPSDLDGAETGVAR